MTDRTELPPLFPACGLWEKQSRRGNAYLVGRLGGLRVMVVPNLDREDENAPSHTLLITAAPQNATQSAAQPAATQAPARRYGQPQRSRSPARGHGIRRLPLPNEQSRMEDDEIVPF
jgi:hypothetical protein